MTGKRLAILASVAIALMAGAGTAARAQPSPPVPAQQSAAELQKKLDELNRVIADLGGQLDQLGGLDPKLREGVLAAKSRAVQSYYESHISLNQNGDRLREHQQKVFAWQIMAANWLLFVVMIVSLSGVVFAGYEMISTRRLISQGAANANQHAASGNEATPPPDEEKSSPMVSTVTIEPTKIHITSAVIGIIILGLSLGFLYLFLKEVYSIKVLEITDTGAVKMVAPKDPAAASEAAKADTTQN